MYGWSARDYPTPESTPSPPASIKQERAPSEDLIPASSSPDLKPASTLPLPLEEDRKDQQKVDKQRTVPCEQCRKIRRACKWIEREGKLESCERCRTTGKRCSGPTRRSPSTLEVQVQLPPARQRQSTKRTASIGPSSPEVRWSTLHLSYSLKYHLVETGLQSFADGYLFDSFDYAAFVGRLNSTRGRLGELEPDEQLFSLAQMHAGIQFSNHSALLRTSTVQPQLETLLDAPTTPHESLSKIGISRREPFLAVARQIVQAAQEQHLDSRTPQQAMERVSVWRFVTTTVRGFHDFNQELLLLMQRLIRRAVDYSRTLSPSTTESSDFLMPLQELVLEGFDLALQLDQPPPISPAEYRTLFGPHPTITFPVFPSDISFIFSRPPELAEVRQVAFAFQQLCHTFSDDLYRRLLYILAYTPATKMESAIQYCWQQVEKLWDIYHAMINRIRTDYRYDPNYSTHRPRTCLNILVFAELDSLFILKSCHNIILRLLPSSHLFSKSRQLWYAALSRAALHLQYLPTYCRSTFDLLFSYRHLSQRIRACPQDILLQWATTFPTQRDEMKKALNLASYSLPDASQLVELLASCSIRLV